jgi:hypothetical protein
MTDLELDVAESFERIYPVPVANEDWDDVLDRAGGQEPRIAPATGGLSALRKRPGRVTLAFTILAGAVGAALFLSAPWTSSPGLLERAQAALTPPAGSVLHLRWNETHISVDLGCKVELTTQELWVDQQRPHRYRAIRWQPPTDLQSADSRTNACNQNGGTAEVGGVGTVSTPLVFVPPNTLRRASGVTFGVTPNPVTKLQQAIAGGSAHDEGTTELDGRTVRRIRIEFRCPGQPCADFAYVDPETYAFVREEWPLGFTFRPGPDWTDYRFDVVLDYLTFEYLPRTAANLALTDIRAQHPDATGP